MAGPVDVVLPLDGDPMAFEPEETTETGVDAPGADEDDAEPKIEITDEELVQILVGYNRDAEEGRKGGENPRDETWRQNIDLYWDRVNFEDKDDWQAREVIPTVSEFCDRFAAAMRSAFIQAGDDLFTVEDPTDQNSLLEPSVKRVMKSFLAASGRTIQGHPIPFSAIFQQAMKAGTFMNAAMAVTWNDGLRTDNVDSRNVWIDVTGRNLYRRRRREIDKYELLRLKKLKDREGEPLYKADAIDRLEEFFDSEKKVEREQSSGSIEANVTGRQPRVLDEYLATIVTASGEVVAENSYVVMANEREIIRGPEPNPFWHGMDWVVTSALIQVPFAPYGKTYAESFGKLARLLTEMVNLLLDAVFTASMNVNAILPHLLEDPKQVADGIHPNMTIKLSDEVDDARRVLSSIKLGEVPPEMIAALGAVQRFVQDAGSQNDITLGRIPAKGGATATEIGNVSENASSMVRDIVIGVEQNFLEPVLNLAWATIVQHVDPMTQPWVVKELGEDVAAMIAENRAEWRERTIRFRVRGLSGLLDRQQKLRGILQILGVVAQNEVLTQEFMKTFDPGLLIQTLFRHAGLDTESFKRKVPLQPAMPPGMPGAAPGGPPGGGSRAPSPETMAGSEGEAVAAALGALGGGAIQ